MEVAAGAGRLGRGRDRGRFPHRLAGRLRGGPRDCQECPRLGDLRAGRAAGRPTSIAAWEAVQYAERPRIHVFLATSAIHREFKLKMDKEQIVAAPWKGCRRAAGYCGDVEFSPEDAARTELDFLCQVVEAAIAAGATTVNIPDTVGYATPAHMANVIRTLRQRVPNIDRAVISVHCHNDLGLAVANSLAAVEAGAGQVECTINGIGERAGNCSLEEIVMALRTRQDYFHCHTGHRHPTDRAHSRLVSSITGIDVQRNKAIVGQNAFAHEAGIHQDGMLKEPLDLRNHAARGRGPHQERPGAGQAQRPGGAGRSRQGAGLSPQPRAAGKAVPAIQADLADKKKNIYDGDLAALIEQQFQAVSELFTLDSYDMILRHRPHAPGVAALRRGNEFLETTMSCGDGPIDAIFLAIEELTGFTVQCRDFQVHSVTVGKDAQGEVMVVLEHEGQIYRGRGMSTDSVEASAKAFLNAVNRIAAVARAAEGQGHAGAAEDAAAKP